MYQFYELKQKKLHNYQIIAARYWSKKIKSISCMAEIK